MKQKVTITFTIDPREYGQRGDAMNAVMLAATIPQCCTTPVTKGVRFRVSSGKIVRYYTPKP